MDTDPDRMAALMVGFPEARVLEVTEDSSGLHIEIETAEEEATCPQCGEPAVRVSACRSSVGRPCSHGGCASGPASTPVASSCAQTSLGGHPSA